MTCQRCWDDAWLRSRATPESQAEAYEYLVAVRNEDMDELRKCNEYTRRLTEGGPGMTDPDELRRLEKAATPGPWAVESDGVYNDTRSYMVVPLGDSEQDDADAALIAAMRNALPALLDVAEAAQAVCGTDNISTAHWDALDAALTKLKEG